MSISLPSLPLPPLSPFPTSSLLTLPRFSSAFCFYRPPFAPLFLLCLHLICFIHLCLLPSPLCLFSYFSSSCGSFSAPLLLCLISTLCRLPFLLYFSSALVSYFISPMPSFATPFLLDLPLLPFIFLLLILLLIVLFLLLHLLFLHLFLRLFPVLVLSMQDDMY